MRSHFSSAVAPVLHLVKSAAYSEGRLLTLEEVRANLEAPPAGEVEWRVFTLVPRREVTVRAQRWWDARLMGALQLGLVPERVSCVRADEARDNEAQESALSGTGVA